jgi:hypothetical protein
MSWGVFILCNRIKGDNISLWVALANEKKHPLRKTEVINLNGSFQIIGFPLLHPSKSFMYKGQVSHDDENRRYG